MFYCILANKSVLSGMPPGVGPIVSGHQYILSQQGIPGYYHQSHPVMYSDEHLQMVQSRLPHHLVKYTILLKKQNYTKKTILIIKF